jgi:MFS superfamily sulfate permease-like transporter
MTELAQARTGPARAPVVLRSLRGYRGAWLASDVLAAVTLLAIAVPEQLATSRLAGMPPVTGFYAFVAGTVLFALLGSNPRMSVGADSTIAPLFAVGVASFAASGTPQYQDLVGILAVMVGALVALVWLARLGWIAELLSAPIIAGFLAGIAVIIIVHQLPDLFGVHSGGGSTLHRIGSVVSHLGHMSVATFVIGVAVFALVIGAERIDGRLPGALAGLVGATIVVAVAHLDHHGVEVLGPFAHGAPRLGLRGVSWATIQKLAPLAGVVALVVITQSAATTRAFAAEEPYPADVGLDFLGVGAGNVAAGLVGAFPVNASPARTAAVSAARGRTQLACLLAALGVAAVVPAAGLLREVPLAALAGVLLYVATRIFHLGELRAIARFDPFELALAVITLLAVALIGVEQGVGVAVGLAILDRTRLTARPQLHVLGRIPGTTSWAPMNAPQRPAEINGVLVVLFAAPLWYANATQFRAALDHARRRSAQAPRLVVLDALGMYDVDFTGAQALSLALDALSQDNVTFAVARAGDHLKANLARAGLLQRIGADHFYASVDEAVTAA